QEVHRIEARTEDSLRVRSEVATEDLLIDRAKVDRVLEVAGAVQRRQARLVTVQAAPGRVTDEQEWSGGSMVGAAAGVLFRPSPELRPGCDQYLVRLPVSGEILVESAHGRVEIAHQVVVAAELGVVRVESPERHVQQLHASARNDQLGGQLERSGQLV